MIKLSLIYIFILIQQIYAQNRNGNQTIENAINNRANCNYNQAASFLNCDDVQDLNTLDVAQATSIGTFRIKPKVAIRFEGNLNLNGNENKFEDDYKIFLENFNGFDINANPFNDILMKRGSLLELTNSTFNFYSNQNTLFSSNCTYYGNTNFKPLFSSFDSIFMNGDVMYRDQLCPLIFQNANIKRMTVDKLKPTNSFSFVTVNNGANELNSIVEELDLISYESKVLDASLLNEFVFK